MKSNIPITIGITGHRDVTIGDISSAAVDFSNWLVEFARGHQHTPLRLLTGMAEGADRMAARVFIEVRDKEFLSGNRVSSDWELIALLPFDAEAYKNDFPNSTEEFDELLKQATSVVTLMSPDLEAIHSNPDLRTYCYEALGRHFVQHSNILVAFWDGVNTHLRGGTSHVVQMKLDSGNIAAASFSAAMHDCGPVWHIPVRRSADAIGSSTQRELPAWLTPSVGHNSLETAQSHWQQIDKFNAVSEDIVTPESLKKQSAYLSPDVDSYLRLWRQLGLLDQKVLNVQSTADIVAQKFDRARMRLTRLLYILGGLLAAALWTGLDDIFQPFMAAAYVVIVVSIYVVFRLLRRPELRDDGLSYRFLAEALRVQLYWSLEHITDDMCRRGESEIENCSSSEIMCVLDALLSQQSQEIGWVREALRIGALDPRKGNKLDLTTKMAHIEHWISDQLNYFRKAEVRHEKSAKKIQFASFLFVAFGIMGAAAVVYHDSMSLHDETLRHIFAISAAVFPPWALLLESFKDRLALEEQQKSCRRMIAIFDRANTRLKGQKEDSKQLPLLIKSLGREALAECAYWLVLRKSKPPQMPT